VISGERPVYRRADRAKAAIDVDCTGGWSLEAGRSEGEIDSGITEI